jgi:hypothetical protein
MKIIGLLRMATGSFNCEDEENYQGETMSRLQRSIAFLSAMVLLVGLSARAQKPDEAARRKESARLTLRLSEPGGYFGSDNLVSNELSYQHVLNKLEKMNITGGAYLGVGPDQNYTYIAQIKPRLAFMIDIRRDNMLQHLMFKALFILGRNRLEYLSLLFGKPLPPNPQQWQDRSIRDLVDYIDRTASDPKLVERTRSKIHQLTSGFGIPLSESDKAAINHIYDSFVEAGLEVRYTIRDRPSGRTFFPPYRELLLERDLEGRQRNYLAAEADYRFLKQMMEEDRIIPVTGDLSGPHALRSIGQYLTEIGERVSAFYTSNVEFYLMRQGGFERFVENLKSLPIDQKSVIIRSYFNYAYYANQHPQTVDNYFSVQLLQTIESLIKDQHLGGYESYYDLVTRRSLDLR